MNPTKWCKGCNQTLHTSNFPLDASRLDGLKTYCKSCGSKHVPVRKNRKLDEVDKECVCCGRLLNSRMFTNEYHTEDGLSRKCRICKSWRDSGTPTLEEVVEFQDTLYDILRTAASMVSDPCRDRALYENFIAKEFYKRKISAKWGPPIWVNQHTLLD